jgi:hypothetical protein
MVMQYSHCEKGLLYNVQQLHNIAEAYGSEVRGSLMGTSLNPHIIMSSETAPLIQQVVVVVVAVIYSLIDT